MVSPFASGNVESFTRNAEMDSVSCLGQFFPPCNCLWQLAIRVSGFRFTSSLLGVPVWFCFCLHECMCVGGNLTLHFLACVIKLK